MAACCVFRVGELYEAVVSELGLSTASQVVLLASGGRQLQRREPIASYSAGTVSQSEYFILLYRVRSELSTVP